MEVANQTTSTPQTEQKPEQEQETSLEYSGAIAGKPIFQPPSDSSRGKPQPSLTPANILNLQRTIGNRAVQRLIARSKQPTGNTSRPNQIQRVLIPEATRAFESAISENSEYEEARDHTDTYMPKNFQEQLTNVTGRATKVKQKFVKDQKKKDLKDFVRAYLLKQGAAALHNLYEGPKHKDKTKEQKDKKVKDYLPRSLLERDKYAPLLSMGLAAPETIAFLKSQDFESAEGMEATPEELQKVKDKGPHIDVRSTFLAGPIFGMNLRAHLFIVYTNSEGQQYYLRGGPSADGFTTADYGPYEQDTVDFDPSAPSVTVLKGEAAVAKIDVMIDAAKSIRDMKVPYIARGSGKDVLKGENCNATAYTILKKTGVPTDKPTGVHPGWGAILGTYSGEGEAFEGQADGPPTPNRLKGSATDAIDFFRDQEGLEQAGAVPGGSYVIMLAPDPDKLPKYVKVKIGDKTGYVHFFTLMNYRTLLSGRKFKIDHKELVVDVLAFDSNTDAGLLKANDVIEVLNKDFNPEDDTYAFQQIQIKFGANQLGRIRGMYIVDMNYKAPKEDDEVEAEQPKDVKEDKNEEVIVADLENDKTTALLQDLGVEGEVEDLQAKPPKVIVPTEGAPRPFKISKGTSKEEMIKVMEKNGAPSLDWVADGDTVEVFFTNFAAGKAEWANILVKISYDFGGTEDIGYVYGRNLAAAPVVKPKQPENAEAPQIGKGPEGGKVDDNTMELEEIEL